MIAVLIVLVLAPFATAGLVRVVLGPGDDRNPNWPDPARRNRYHADDPEATVTT